LRKSRYWTPKIQDGGILDFAAKMQKRDFLKN